jgi:iron(III) transport system ATP-binding protein
MNRLFQPFLELQGISVVYPCPGESLCAVKQLDLQLEQGEVGCLLGASGCGKTTILRAIAGFEPLQSGMIRLAGRELSAGAQQIAPEQRGVGMMFQDYALFPHLTVEKNIGFGLRRQCKAERVARIDEMLELVGLQAERKRYPHELSGGQQQRVALARALAPSPSLLLLDEPFSNLDVDTRERLAFEVRDILKQAGLTAILVTHNQAEAFAIADCIGVMQQGQIVQWGTPLQLHEQPANDFVAEFIRREALLTQRSQALMRDVS